MDNELLGERDLSWTDRKRRNREINGVGEALPGDALKDEWQGVARLQLDNDGAPVADRDHIAAVDFSLHGIALRLEGK